MNLKRAIFVLVLAGFCAAALPSQASLSLVNQWVGDYGYAQSGCGSVTQLCTINLGSVPMGATITQAYMYSAEFGGPFVPSVSLNGTSLIFHSVVMQSPTCCGLGSARADVTSIVNAAWNSTTGTFSPFTVQEGATQSGIDGEALIVVYKFNNPLILNTVAVLDGWSTSSGDHSTITFANPLSGFAQMSIADSFSCCGQNSTITVNGTVITTNAGNNDDSQDGFVSNGNLITSGGPGSPYPGFSSCLPSYTADHESYDLVACAGVTGATTVNVSTVNPSGDDNIFEESFWVAGQASVSTTPEPGTLVMFGSGIVGLAGLLRRKLML
ncbi:MAG TPA: PEP-CTERM sorting domain-containing protein [Terriglobales bacterium]